MQSTCLRSAELAQPRADGAGGVAADAGVDLVEHERRVGRDGAWATLMIASITRESSPPEAISRSGPAGTPGFGAIRNSTASPPVGTRLARLERDVEGGVAPSPARQLLAHAPARDAGRPLARLAQRARRGRAERRAAPRCSSRGGLGERDLGAGELLAPRTRTGRRARAPPRAPAVLAHQPVDAGEPLFELLERAILAGESAASQRSAAAARRRGPATRSRARAAARRARRGAGRRRRARRGSRRRRRSAATPPRPVGGVFGRERVGAGAGGRRSASRRRSRSRAASSSSCSCWSGASASISASS